jgi:hypothetical protein
VIQVKDAVRTFRTIPTPTDGDDTYHNQKLFVHSERYLGVVSDYDVAFWDVCSGRKIGQIDSDYIVSVEAVTRPGESGQERLIIASHSVKNSMDT